MSGAYYNEIDPKKADWLRTLILFGHIAPGDVDERDIRDVQPDDLRGYTQHHFFAGIGGWSYALRRAGWADDRPIATISCPCQPFSEAGAGGGFADERHLWPAAYHLVRECGFPVVAGEQVASNLGLKWFDLVSADMEAAGYTGGAILFPAAGVGAPCIRHRNYFTWLAESARQRREGTATRTQSSGGVRLEQRGQAGGVGGPQRVGFDAALGGDGRGEESAGSPHGNVADRPSGDLRPGPINGFWRDADWIACTDGSWRPVEPGTFPLANGAPGRMGRLRGYGDALNAEAATAYIEAVMEAVG